MDLTPQEASGDSGCHSGTFSSSSRTYDYSWSNTNYVETPTIPSCYTRKRKLTEHLTANSQDTFSFDTPSSSLTYAKQSNFLSSTLNDSLSKSLEKCVIGNTPNYLEFTPIEDVCQQRYKRYKLDDSTEYQPKTRSAPTTPTKQFIEDIKLCSPSKSESEHLDYKSSETKKPYRKFTKLGSPERLELLYPNLKPIQTPIKLRTPEKLREFIKKINSPAKKRLFDNKQVVKKPLRKLDYDPISVFFIKNDFRHIVSKIFSYLSGFDLYLVSKVSRSWRKALVADYAAFPRYIMFAQKYNVNKENASPLSAMVERKVLYEDLQQDYFHRYRKVVVQLTPSQSLQKCPQCMQPSVIERSISQCQNPNCQYISCIKCLCFSTSGPANFVDKCRTSELILKEPRWINDSCHLNDISNIDHTASFHDSSGYLSETDFSPAIARNLSLTMDTTKSSILHELNRNIQYPPVYKKHRRSSLCSVISSSSTPNTSRIEPSSPPQVKAVACSKQSKRNLKRLQF